MSLRVLREKTLEPEFYLYTDFPAYFNAVLYAGIFAKEHAREILSRRSLGPIVTAAREFDTGSWQSLRLERRVSFILGLLCMLGMWLAARIIMDEGFALLAALLYGLSPLAVSFSHLGKNDIFMECAEIFSLYFMFQIIKSGRLRDYLLAAFFAALCFDSKINFAPSIALGFATLVRASAEKQTLKQWVTDRRFLLAAAAGAASMLLFSPYYFINFEKSLQMIGWLYFSSGFNSYNHIDPHHWWLDKYFYSSFILPNYLLGAPVFLAALAGFAHRSLKIEFNAWFMVVANTVGFIYIFSSSNAGSFPLYLFLNVIPYLILLAAGAAYRLWQKGWKKSAGAVAAILVISSAVQAQNYYAVNFKAFDVAGPELAARIPAHSRVLGFSVYTPGPALSQTDYRRGWPQNLERKAVEDFNPDYILVYKSDFSGFEKFYRETMPINERYHELMSGKWGWHEVKSWKISYPGDFLYQWLDPEFMIELVLLEKAR